MDKIMFKKVKITLKDISFIFKKIYNYKPDTFPVFNYTVPVPYTDETPPEEIHRRALLIVLALIVDGATNIEKIEHVLVDYNKVTFKNEGD